MKILFKSRDKCATGDYSLTCTRKRGQVKYLKYIIGLLLFWPGLALAQEFEHPDSEETKQFINQVSEIYGVDDELINGYPYRAPSQAILSHPYFRYEAWARGDVFMSGESYPGKQVKYDLVKDAMILKADLQGGVNKIVHLNSLYVDSVKIRNHLFVHSRKYFPPDSIETFYEEIFMIPDNKFGLLIHYSKKYLSQYTSIAPRGRFSDMNTDRWLVRNGKSIKVNRRRSFLKQFDKDKRSAIRSFLRGRGIRYRKASQRQLKELMRYCSENIINN
ncbi:MAG: hypothetical protein K9J27_10005 [Bacteroidales bacterium]|nr:hypothetical protein [Bacteroidales bacterium]MCF8334138.1 hypothetical protein [Bacteroidales bacterium]